jgi:hypothetical protein
VDKIKRKALSIILMERAFLFILFNLKINKPGINQQPGIPSFQVQ